MSGLIFFVSAFLGPELGTFGKNGQIGPHKNSTKIPSKSNFDAIMLIRYHMPRDKILFQQLFVAPWG